MRGREEKINHKPRSEIHYIYTLCYIFYKALWVRDDDDDGDDNLIVCARYRSMCVGVLVECILLCIHLRLSFPLNACIYTYSVLYIYERYIERLNFEYVMLSDKSLVALAHFNYK